MRQLSIFTGLVFFLTGCGGIKSVDDNSTPELLAQTILTAVATQDKELFTKYVYSDRAELENFFIKSTNNKLTDFHTRWLGRTDEDRQWIIDSFDPLQTKFREKGLNDWSNVKFKTAQFSLVESNGAEFANNLRIVFTNDDFLGEIKVDHVYKTERGWVMVHRAEFRNYVINRFM